MTRLSTATNIAVSKTNAIALAAGHNGINFATLKLALLAWIAAERRALRKDVDAAIVELRERMARLEGLFEGFTKRPPEDR